MNGGAPRALLLTLALLLGLGTALGAWRAHEPREREPLTSGGLWGAEQRGPMLDLLRRLVAGLARLQESDGGFALYEPQDRPGLPEPEVKRSASSALAAWALGEAARLLASDPAGSEARGAAERARSYLRTLQQPDGSLGRMPRNPLGVLDPGPEQATLAAGLIAFARSGDPSLALPLGLAARALATQVGAGVRDGWLRALCAMAIDALLEAGRAEALGREPRRALALGVARSDPDCGDYRLAEAIVRTLRGEAAAGDLFPEAVLGACLTKESVTWSGQTTDLASWLMQSWLAARARQGEAWFRAAAGPLGEAVGSAGIVPGGIYADRVAQSAAGVLVIAHGYRSQPPVDK